MLRSPSSAIRVISFIIAVMEFVMFIGIMEVIMCIMPSRTRAGQGAALATTKRPNIPCCAWPAMRQR